MFTILGADGKEYGPVAAGKIHEWIIGGRANGQTKAKRAGEDQWRTLADFPEFNLAPPSTPPLVTDSPAAASPIPAMAATPLATVPAAGNAEPADRGMRLLSFCLDYLLGLCCALPGMLLLGPAFLQIVLAAARGQQPDFSALDAGGFLLGALVLFLGSFTLLGIQIWLLSTRGQTLAKIILHLRVVRHPDHVPAGFVHAWLLRNLVPGVIQCLPWIGMVFFLVDAGFIFSAERRCLHDQIAGTMVVKVVKVAKP
jgi:uncharacterized RDD family membrane protein YckC